MIRRKNKRSDADENIEPKWFDDFELRLGDIMRGERATLGKSLLDVQRELKIKASYIAAIENCDPDAFDTPGFIAGYVRSYARYLGMDPDKAFAAFCAESGFSTAHGMSEAASSVKKESFEPRHRSKERGARDPILEGATPFAPSKETMFSRVEPGAVGSLLVLVALVAALGFGGWTVLNEVQRVQLAPVENTPDVLADLDPLEQATRRDGEGRSASALAQGGVEGFDRLYRPEALDVPVLVARDAPISTLKPSEIGSFAAVPELGSDVTDSRTPSFASYEDGVQIVAARPAWIRVSDAEGEMLFSGILNGGETLKVPQGVAGAAPQIRVGESGSIYYLVDGKAYGPTGPRGAITEGFSLAAEAIVTELPEAILARDSDLASVMASLGAQTDGEDAVPLVFAQERDVVTVIATREVWLRVSAASGTILHEAVMQPGDFYTVPQTDEPATIRAGDAGAVYFATNGQTYGPYGERGAVADNLQLTAETITAKLVAADWQTSEPLAKAVARLDADGAFEAALD